MGHIYSRYVVATGRSLQEKSLCFERKSNFGKMKFQGLFVFLAITALCMIQIIDADAIGRTKRADEIDWCAEDSEFPAWQNFFAFLGWCKDGTVGTKPPKPDE